MVPALLWRKLRAGVPRDPVPENRLLALELARFVIGVHPVSDLAAVSGLFAM